MDAREVRRRAIAAVAKLSIFAGFAGATGCGSAVVVEQEGDPAIDPGEPGEMTPNTPEVVVDVPGAPEIPTPLDSACFETGKDSKACCADVIKAAFADDHLFTDPSLATAAEKDCCELAVSYSDTWMGPEENPFMPDYYSCCSTGLVSTAFEDHPACSPWGPPMPPAMPGSMDRVFTAGAGVGLDAEVVA